LQVLNRWCLEGVAVLHTTFYKRATEISVTNFMRVTRPPEGRHQSGYYTMQDKNTCFFMGESLPEFDR